MPSANNRRSLADILNEPMTEQEESWGRIWAESLVYRSSPQVHNWSNAGGRLINHPAEQRILVYPSENLRNPTESTVWIPPSQYGESRPRRPIFIRPQEPWVIERPTDHEPPSLSTGGFYGNTVTLPVPPVKPDYEVVTDTVLIDLILEHVKPWFNSRANVDIRINKLEKVNIKASLNRYRVFAGYKYTESAIGLWRQATLWVTHKGEVEQ